MNTISIKEQLIFIIFLIGNQANAGDFQIFEKQLIDTGVTLANIKFIINDLKIENRNNNIVDKNGCGQLNFNIAKAKLNSKKSLGIIISIGNTCTSGSTGMHTYLYEKSFNGTIKRKFNVLGISATEIIDGKNISFRIEGPGFCHPIYRENSKNNYEYICSEEEITDGCLRLSNVNPCTETSRKQ